MKAMSATATGDEHVFEVPMKALIIYGEIALATQAKAMLERAAQRADATAANELQRIEVKNALT